MSYQTSTGSGKEMILFACETYTSGQSGADKYETMLPCLGCSLPGLIRSLKRAGVTCTREKVDFET